MASVLEAPGTLTGAAGPSGTRSGQTREEVVLRLRGVDPRLAQDERLLRPGFLPAVLAEDHEPAVHRDLRDVALDGPPLAIDRVPADVDPGRDRLVGHEHLLRELLELGALLRRRVLGRLPEARLAGGAHPLGHRLTDRDGDRRLVQLRRRPRHRVAFELLRVPGGIAGPRERPDRHIVDPDMVGVAVAAEA